MHLLVKIVNYSILKHYTNLQSRTNIIVLTCLCIMILWDENIMRMQFMSTVSQPFWFRGHKLFGTCMLQSTLNPTMGAIYIGYFDNEINNTFLQLRLDMMSDVLKTFFVCGHIL